MKKILSLFLLALLPMVANADAVEIDGIYYNLTLNGKTAEVTSPPNGWKYSGVVTIPESVNFKGGPYSVTSIGNNAFYSCTSLTSITIPNSVTSIGVNAFYYCIWLEKVIISDIGAWCGILFGNETANPLYYANHLYSDEKTEITDPVIPDGVTSIGDYAFRNCSGLTSVTIPNSVTSIGDYAFHNCSGLTSVTIPNSVTSIGDYAFQYCRDLADVYCYAENVPSTGSNAFINSYVECITLHVPASLIEQYEATVPWNSFGLIVPLDEDIPELEKCATPTISYANGELTFNCETEGAVCQSSITDTDIALYSTNKVQLSATYTISVYAIKNGYNDSDVATATLCWIDVEPQTEGITDDNATYMETKALPVLIQSQGGSISIQGAAEGTPIAVYDMDGRQHGTGFAEKGCATIATSLRAGSVAVVKIGEKSIKVLIK